MESKSQAVLYLLPSPIHSEALNTVSLETTEVLLRSKLLIVENLKTVRGFISKLKSGQKIDDWLWEELNEHTESDFYSELVKQIELHQSACLISEAGTPAVADPGERLVKLCHSRDIKVVPIPGPNSIIMALCASGLNGQRFAFNSYLPVKPLERKSAIKKIESIARKEGITQAFIEAPYRNNALLDSLLEVLQGDTLLCLAVNLTAPDEWVKTQTVTIWRKKKPILEKVPALFLVGY